MRPLGQATRDPAGILGFRWRRLRASDDACPESGLDGLALLGQPNELDFVDVVQRRALDCQDEALQLNAATSGAGARGERCVATLVGPFCGL